MSGFVPKVENQVKWGFTEEMIFERWKLWQDWDSLARLFGEKTPGSDFRDKIHIPKQNVNSRALDKILDNL